MCSPWGEEPSWHRGTQMTSLGLSVHTAPQHTSGSPGMKLGVCNTTGMAQTESSHLTSATVISALRPWWLRVLLGDALIAAAGHRSCQRGRDQCSLPPSISKAADAAALPRGMVPAAACLPPCNTRSKPPLIFLLPPVPAEPALTTCSPAMGAHSLAARVWLLYPSPEHELSP